MRGLREDVTAIPVSLCLEHTDDIVIKWLQDAYAPYNRACRVIASTDVSAEPEYKGGFGATSVLTLE
jgi:hypothetical protein